MSFYPMEFYPTCFSWKFNRVFCVLIYLKDIFVSFMLPKHHPKMALENEHAVHRRKNTGTVPSDMPPDMPVPPSPTRTCCPIYVQMAGE
jgi:hypothetical protein